MIEFGNRNAEFGKRKYDALSAYPTKRVLIANRFIDIKKKLGIDACCQLI